MNYYNEFDPYPAQWLRNLIAAGHLPDGDVDERPIQEIKPDDLKGYTQCHFFAGIGGWSYALRLAGWPDNRPVWTGSCPCQPFSVAGKGKAQSDERHLWPAWFDLIKSVKPPVLFGEQVAGAISHGWLDDAFDDLEGEGYETAAAVLPACSVGAPHKRDRLWFVGYSEHNGLPAAAFTGSPATPSYHDTQGQDTPGEPAGASLPGSSGVMANSAQQRFNGSGDAGAHGRNEPANSGETMANSHNTRSQGWNGAELPECSGEQFAGESGAYASNPTSERSFPAAHAGLHSGEKSAGPRHEQSERCNPPGRYTNWDSEPGMGRVADGVPARVGRLRAYGNAIVPQVAAEFIKAAGS